MKRKLKTIINLFIAVTVIYKWLVLAITGGSGVLVLGGFSSLRFFTILSNLLDAAACVYWLLTGSDRLKYAGTTSTALTFTVVMVFLGPLMGYRFLFTGINFWFHFLIPAVACFEFIFLCEESVTERDSVLATVPMILYGIFYVSNILINGIPGNDWYLFMTWGYPVGFAIFFLIVFVTYSIARLLRFLKKTIPH